MPVIVEQVTIELRESVDYISVTQQGSGVETNAQTREAANKAGGGPAGMTVSEAKESGAGEVSGGVVTRVPTDSVFTVLVQPVYSRKKIKDKFNLKDFANGTLAKDGFI